MFEIQATYSCEDLVFENEATKSTFQKALANGLFVLLEVKRKHMSPQFKFKLYSPFFWKEFPYSGDVYKIKEHALNGDLGIYLGSGNPSHVVSIAGIYSALEVNLRITQFYYERDPENAANFDSVSKKTPA